MSKREEIIGGLWVLLSAVIFYAASVVIKMGTSLQDLDHGLFTLARFIIGFILVEALLRIRGKRPESSEKLFLWLRAITNFIAVYLFFKAIEVGSLTSANILNLTYPVFIAAYVLLVERGQRDIGGAIACIVAFLGIVFVLCPTGGPFDWNGVWGLWSGFFSSLAVMSLNRTRQSNDTETVLWYMFGLGTLCSLAFFWDKIRPLSGEETMLLFVSGVLGFFGQFCLTQGFRHVTAVEGSIIGSTRILIAAILGPLVIGETLVSYWSWLGALLIFSTNVYLAVRKLSV